MSSDEISAVVEQCWKDVHATCESESISQETNTEEVVTAKKHHGWRVVRVFVSSTFSDYHAEREVLVKKVFPPLREWCESRMLHLIDLDLRWGVPKDSTTENTIKICLEELDRCREETNGSPFFINMIGERFGWMPSANDISTELVNQYQWVFPLSITSMEIMHGAFRKKNPNAVFFLRQSDFLKDIPEEFDASFVEQTGLGIEQLKALKSELMKRFTPNQVVEYSCQYDGVDDSSGANKVRLKGLDDFCHNTMMFFKDRIEATYPEMGEPMTQSQIEMASQWAFIESRGSFVVGRDKEIEQIMNYCLSFKPEVENAGKHAPLLLLGNDGLGKSSVMAHCVKKLKQVQDIIVFSYFVGSCSNSTSLLNLLRHLCSFLSSRIPGENSQDLSEKDINQLSELAKKLIEDAVKLEKTFVIMFDGLNSLSDAGSTNHLNWLPESSASNVRIVASCQSESFSARRLLQRPGHEMAQIVLGDLDYEARREISETLLGIYKKQLDSEQMELLIQHSGAAIPMWLSSACEELRVFGVFEKVTQRIKDLPDDLKGLSRFMLERIVSDDETECVKKTLALLACSLSGLTEDELKWLLSDNIDDKQIPMLSWILVRSCLKHFLTIQGGNRGQEKWFFSHSSVKEAVREWLLEPAEVENEWRCKLADFFDKKCTDVHRAVEELPYQLKHTFQYKRLVDFMRKDNRSFKLPSYEKALMYKNMRCQNVITGNNPQFEFPAYMCTFCINKTRGFGQISLNKQSCVVCGFYVHIKQQKNEAFYCVKHRTFTPPDTSKCVVCGNMIFFKNNQPYEKCYTCHFCFQGVNRCIHINL